MLNDPSVDSLMKEVECKYELVTVLSKRARVIMEKKPEYLKSTNMHPVTLAAQELESGKIKVEQEQ